MKRYGIPYKGSKNGIAEWVVDILPEADNLYDLFAGGCAVTHCAMESGKWENYIINDIEPGIVQLFKDAINGKLANEERWISRETFEMFKDTDPYIRYVWSFGNNGREYLYAPEIERFKKHLHFMFFAKTPEEAQTHWRAFVKEFDLVERLQRLQRLKGLEAHAGYYRDINVKPNSVIYCDIPYVNTEGYGNISEYWMPEDRFECIAERMKVCCYGASRNRTIEKIFVPRR